jgi:hypothetical protein
MQPKGTKLVLDHDASAAPVSNIDAAGIRDALADILRSAPFRNSRQSQLFLSYIVERSLAGETELLRERVIGAEVFGRDATYDPSQDPIVRVCAGQVRKRLAQYYQDRADHSVSVEVPPGSYKAFFHAKAAEPAKPAGEPAQLDAGQSAKRDVVEARPQARRWRWAGAGLAVLALAIVPVRALRLGTSALDRFWAPVLSSPKPVLIYNATSKVYQPNYSIPMQAGADPLHRPMIPVSGRYTCVGDAYTGAVLASLFSEKGKLHQLRWGSDVSFGDLRYQPSILIGAFNNVWALETTGELRFTFERHLAIRDRAKNWVYQLADQPQDKPEPEDYAVVSRVFNSKTGELLISAGGITDYGTYAAGEFLTSPQAMEQLAARAPADWQKKNMQVLLHTKVVGETPGPPSIVTAHFW